MKQFFAVTLFAAAVGAQATPNIPPLPQREPLLLRNATLHPVTGPVITNGSLLIEAGKIRAMGGADLAAPAGAKTVDLGGRHVYPGFVAANTSLGLTEIRSVNASNDSTETGALNPNARALVAFNADSELLPVTRAGGVLTALSVPEAGRTGLIAGTSALLKLDGWNWQDMALVPEFGLHIVVPRLRLNSALFPNQSESRLAEIRRSTEARLKLLDDAFESAKAYALARAADPATPVDTRWEAMRPVLPASPGATPARPVVVHADDLAQIRFALDFAARHGLKLILSGGADAWRGADTRRERQIPVIIDGLLRLPMRRDDPPDALFSLPAKLAAAGVRYCIADGGRDSTNARNLPFEAAHARAFGLSDDEALKAVTLYPAQILGIADKLGSLEVGKLATLFVADGDPLEPTTRIERVFMQGREVELSDRQTALRDKYLKRQ